MKIRSKGRGAGKPARRRDDEPNHEDHEDHEVSK